MTRQAGLGGLRVAIIGVGPKGLFALERLLAELAAMPKKGPVEVNLFEPHPAPGAGRVYDPEQPGYLLMNFADELIDMWPPSDVEPPPICDPVSFVDWRGPGAQGEYAPRSEVGRYLAAGFECLSRHAPAGVRLRRYPRSVERIRPRDGEWSLDESDTTYDEVLIATGHAEDWDGDLASSRRRGAAPLIDSVYPVESLGIARVAPGSVIGVRGMALTMIDCALALTEGRGGTFTPDGSDHVLRYSRAGDEVGAIVPFSRTGRLMLAKPSPRATRDAALDRVAAEGRRSVDALPDGFSIAGGLIPVLAHSAAASLGTLSEDDVQRELLAMLGFGPINHPDPAAELRRSLAISVGAEPADLNWSVGHTWRALYPSIVNRLGANGLRSEEWPAFRQLAVEMERIAFGPPPANAAKLLALIDAGIVDLTHANGRIEETASGTEIRSTSGGRAVDVVIDAVLPGPGVAGIRHGLLNAAVSDGLVRIADGRRGLELTRDMTCVAASGSPNHGLAALGRPTEDWVVGNDTLSRTLHDGPAIWARRVASRAGVSHARVAA